MKKRSVLPGATVLACLIASCTSSSGTPVSAPNSDTPPRIILFVADGAGLGHWTVARVAIGRLAVDDFEAFGLVDTRGSNHLVTGSAPAATAYATGTRTVMRALGLGPDSQPRPTVLEVGMERGMASGLITTTALTDATPAAFCTHYPARDHLEVARQMARHDITVLMGGGRSFFRLASTDTTESVLAQLRARYTYVESAAELTSLSLDTVSTLLGLFSERDMPLAGARAPTLAGMTQTALEILDRDPDGFFLMVENEETDTQAHHNEPFDIIAAEMRAFDEAIEVAVAYRRRHPETLIVVLGDHETGGLAVHTDSTGAPTLRYTTGGHTAALVPIFAVGPGNEQFGGLLSNERVGQRLLEMVRQ
jgi:alkaline phosphatase